jgi:hypothetical protein
MAECSVEATQDTKLADDIKSGVRSRTEVLDLVVK